MTRANRRKTTPFRCGHLRSKANTGRAKSPTGGYEYCRTCAKARNDAWRRENRLVMQSPPIPQRRSLDLSTDEAVQLYRAEKQKRAARPDPRMAEARSEYLTLLENTAPGRSGRPRGSKTGAALSLSGLFQGIQE